MMILPVASGQNVVIGMEARMGYMVDSDPHFYADYLNLKFNSSITDRFSIAWRQRFTKSLTGSQPLNATDFVYLDYSVSDWIFSAGKQVVECGGFEYDAPPIDLHFTTECYNNFNAYQLGVSATRKFGDHRLIAQICRSPYASLDTPENNTLKAFSLALRGTYGRGGWIPMYSLNLFECAPSSYSFQFTMGNRLEVTKSLAFELDFLNRSKPGEMDFLRDWSIIGYVSIIPVEWMEIMLKTTYDRNDLWDDALVARGFDMWKAGVGMYLFPLKEDKTVRFHWYYYHFSDGGNYLQLGLTLKPTLLNMAYGQSR